MLPKNRPPTPPGEMLLEEYLKPRGLTQVELAARMGVPDPAGQHHRQREARHHRRDGHPAVGGAQHLARVLDGAPGRTTTSGTRSESAPRCAAKPQRSKGHGKHQAA